MDRKALLDDIAARLRKAADSSNWHALKLADRELAAQLSKMNAGHTWTKPEWASFLALKRVHGEVRDHCKREAALYAARIAGMRQTKMGWAAYAMHGHDAGGKK